MYNNPEDGLLEDIPDLKHECLDDSNVMMEEDVSITADGQQPSPFNDNYTTVLFGDASVHEDLNFDSMPQS